MGRSAKHLVLLAALLVHAACVDGATPSEKLFAGPEHQENHPQQNASDGDERGELPVPCGDGGGCTTYGDAPSTAAVTSLLTELCARRLRCCRGANDCDSVFGPQIQTVQECVTALEAKQITSVWDVPSLYEIRDALGALEKPDSRVKVNFPGMASCETFIRDSLECTFPISPGRCDPPSRDGEQCRARNLLIGQKHFGEPCSASGAIKECAQGTVCRSPSGSWNGACSPRAQVGDRCTQDDHCDGLFCNPATYKCQAKSGVGEPCAHLSVSVSRFETSLDCQDGLQCDLVNQVCVERCQHGTICDSHADCASGLLCDVTINPDNNYSRPGLCVTPLPDGSPCKSHSVQITGPNGNWVSENACASGGCNFGVGDEVFRCGPAG